MRTAQQQIDTPARPTSRVLLIATDEVAGPELIEELRHHLAETGVAEVMVTAPAVEKTAFRHALGDVDIATMEAGQRLETSLDELHRAGIPASDPMVAAEDALRQFAADEVLIVAHASDQARWFEDGLFERAKEGLRPAVRMLAVRLEDDEPPHLVGVKSRGRAASQRLAPDMR